MKPCDSVLSWDGVLCNRCRQVLDSHIVRMMHDQDSCVEEKLEEGSKSLITARRRTQYSNDLWWHPVTSLRACAKRSCRLCQLVLSHISDKDLQSLVSWQATLLATFFYVEYGQSTFWVHIPSADPRPEAESPEPTIHDSYSPLMRIDVKNVLGKTPHVTAVPSADQPKNHELWRANGISGFTTASVETFRQIAVWLQGCQNHRACTDGPAFGDKMDNFQPTRLLELTRGDVQPGIKLVHTTDISTGHVSYATLSHCWGSTPISRLLRCLVKDYSLSVPWESLSLTFQHAVITSLKLEIRYLWIDALCIVQDEEKDWAYEAARMTGVYMNSFLNISADASYDSTEGLFRQRNPETLQSFVIPHCQEGFPRCASIFHLDKWWSSVCNSPLSDRAWTVQERFLAPRGLYFAEDQVHWECLELCTAESLPDLFNIALQPGYTVRKSAWIFDVPAQERMRILYEMWYRLVVTYSKANLTFKSDRAIAIAGLASKFCNLLGLSPNDYLCGMWRSQLAHDLMWKRVANWSKPPQDPRVSNLPSWSWLSLCAHIWMSPRHSTENYLDYKSRITAEVLHASTTPCHTAFGPTSSGEIVLQVFICQVTLEKGDLAFYAGEEDRNHNMNIGGSVLREDEHFELLLDDDSNIGTQQILNTPVYLMLGRASKSANDRSVAP